MLTLKRYSIHRIPTDEVPPEPENTKGKEAVSDYVQRLLGSLRKETSTRNYSFAKDRKPEARTFLLEMLGTGETEFLKAAQLLANRLHEKQLKVQKGTIDIQEGALLCAEVQDGEQLLMLLAKLDWVDYLSTTTWNREEGLPFDKNRLLKTCLCEMTAEGDSWNFDAISLYDSNSTISAFWWREFLELIELTNDATNSQRAYDAWQKLLVREVKRTSPADYHSLRSAVAFRFRNDPAYEHEKFVKDLLDNYQPSNPDLDLIKITKAARELPQRTDAPGKRFDSRFSIDAKACNIKIKPIRLTDGIDLVLREPLENLRSIIRAEKVRGVKGVFIVSEDGYSEVAGKSA